VATRVVAAIALALLTSCAHSNRVSRSAVRKLTKSHEPFVLVFGSVVPVQGVSGHPSIRFVHQLNRTAPEYVLHEIAISSGDRFYAVLKAPPTLPRLDQFETEVRWTRVTYDKVNFVRVAEQPAAVAMYVGELQMSEGQTVAVTVRDDYQSATAELHRLYPKFDGEIIKAPLLRSPPPASAPPKRVQ
jgi:hypothetical protein